MTLIGENNSGGAPSQSDLQSWANQHGLTHPVLADPGFNEAWRYISTESSGSFFLPNKQILAPGMMIISVNESGVASFEQYLPN